jgi:hypothetical protein
MNGQPLLPPIWLLHQSLIETRESIAAEKTEDDNIISIIPDHLSNNQQLYILKTATGRKV